MATCTHKKVQILGSHKATAFVFVCKFKAYICGGFMCMTTSYATSNAYVCVWVISFGHIDYIIP